MVTGRWSFASGIAHADWLIGCFRESGAADGGERLLVFTMPKDEAEVIDTWHVAGLVGTGSMDFRVADVFVPAEMTYPLGADAVRGGALFRLGIPAFVSNEVPPLCVGLAMRALDDMTELASHTARFPGAPTLSERAVFHKELGRAEAKIKAARLLHRDAMQAAWETASSGEARARSPAGRRDRGVGVRRRDLRRGGNRPVQVRRRTGAVAVPSDAAAPAQRPRRPAARGRLRGALRSRRAGAHPVG